MASLRIGVMTCSDTRFAGEAEDTAGKALIALCEERGWSVVAYHVVPDEPEAIAVRIVEMADVDGVDVLLTAGGTGLGPRDVCPETTLAVCDREVPGVAQAIRTASLAITDRAMLSRGAAAQRGRTLVINMPGSEKAVRESFAVVAGVLEHAAEMMAGGGHPQ